MSSFVIAGPEALAAASAEVGGIGSSIREATAAAAYSTTTVLPAAQDEVSAAISALFGTYGQEYQALSAQAAVFHQDFVSLLAAGGGAYATPRRWRPWRRTCWGRSMRPPIICSTGR